MAIDLLDNPSTNGSGMPSVMSLQDFDNSRQKKSLADILTGVADTAALGIDLAKRGGKYVYDTFTADSNSVPYDVRLAVSGARKAEDKLNTLRQFYPDAMPTPDGDFTFVDPKTNKRVTLNDPGLSLGDVVESVPEIGEMVGGTAGAIGGGTLGAAGGPAGVVAGGVLGAGAGAAAGNEIARQGAQTLASLLTGKSEIDNRTAGDVGEDALYTGLLNSAFAGVPFAARGGRNIIASKLLTEESPELVKYLLGKGYEPTLGQVGSQAGKELNKNMAAGGIIENELHNQNVLQKNLNDFLGPEYAGKTQNDLANAFQAGGRLRAADQKENANSLYKNVAFGDDIGDLTKSQEVVADIYKKRGMTLDPKTGTFITPKGLEPNPDFMLDSSMERKMKRIMSGDATEKELSSFRSDISTALRNKDLKYDTKGALMDLKQSITDDLVSGNPNLSEADKLARSAWFKMKEDENTFKNVIGRSEGITPDTANGQGLTEGQSLENAKRVFSNSKMGSDSDAELVSRLLSNPEKKSTIASILTDDVSGKGFQNPLQIANEKFNLERAGKNLLNPNEQESLADLLKQSQGVSWHPEGAVDKTGMINAEALATGLGTAINPYLGAGIMATGNYLRKAPGTFGGYGQLGRSLITQNPFMQKGRQYASEIALNAAKKGESPSILADPSKYMPESNKTLPGAMAAGQAAFGNFADGPESATRIPTPKGEEAPPITLDDLMKEDDQPSGNSSLLDELLNDNSAQPSAQNPSQQPAALPNEKQESVNLDSLSQEDNQKLQDMASGSEKVDPYELAKVFVGSNENKDKQILTSFFKKSMGSNIDPSRIPWCAAFVNSVLNMSGEKGTGKLSARSFLKYGEQSKNPSKGDIVVLSRGINPNQGHVGFFAGFDNNGNILVLGGNQGDSVTVRAYPRNRVLGIRKPPNINEESRDLAKEPM